MTVFVIRRLMQSVLVLLVFVGVFAIGNPIDILLDSASRPPILAFCED